MLTHLRVTGFRNLADARLDLPGDGVALVGANAQGKTNLLEAIYYLEIFRSFRGSPDSRIIRFGEDHFRVEGHRARADGPERVIAAAYQRRGRLKKVVVDGMEPPRLGDAIGKLGTVLFTPEDVRVVSDGPDERRRFLDILLSLNRDGYLETLQTYRQALSQRNAVLREGGTEPSIRAWDGSVVRHGAQVSAMRAAWIAGNRIPFGSVFREISGGEEATMEYQAGSTSEDPPAFGSSDPGVTRAEAAEGTGGAAADPAPHAEWWEGAFQRKLADQFESDRQRGTTQAGPHRDELRMYLAPPHGSDDPSGPSRDLRHYGSGGQRRTAALSLRILEAGSVALRRGEPPILLLDDVFAELDAGRSERLVALLERTAAGQVILTAPKESDLHFRSDRLAPWSIDAGVIRTGSGARA